MATTLSTGSTVSISATLPTTFDDNVTTGYPAQTFTAIGEVIDISGFGKVYNPVSHQSVSTRCPTKKKGVYDIEDGTLTVAMDSTDAGQIIVAAALASDNSYSIKYSTPDGVDHYYTAKVLSFPVGSISGDDTIVRTIGLSVDPETFFEV